MANRRAYTLIELLITVAIISIMAMAVLFAAWSAQETAKTRKTQTLIVKLDSIIRARWESYRTRRVQSLDTVDEPFNDRNNNGQLDAGEFQPAFHDLNGNGVWDYLSIPARSRIRVDNLRDLMRMEMPDRWSDVYDDVATPFSGYGVPLIQQPTEFRAYRAKYTAVTGQPISALVHDAKFDEYQNAECLYMIVMEAVAQEGDSRDTFRPDNVADTDGDGFPEFIDAWGMPIRFLRWAPGFQSELQTLARANPSNVTSPDQHTSTVEFSPFGFDAKPGSYLGGTLAVLDVNGQIDGARMARIVGYSNDGAKAIFTCTTPTSAPDVFGGSPPASTETVVLMGPDQFDSRGIYPTYFDANSSVPTFALYPLVYSAGPDKKYGVISDTTAVLRYAKEGLNSFYVPASGEMIGATNPAANDNIHSHALSIR